DSRQELTAGNGGEFFQKDGRCKAQALHSSSILACNFFDYWRERDLAPLAAVFGTGRLDRLQFEGKFRTQFQGTPPNIDVVLFERDGGLLAIESKFAEPYSTSMKKGRLHAPYCMQPGPWSAVGLSGCQRLADTLCS